MARRKPDQFVRCFDVTEPTLHTKGHTIYKTTQKVTNLGTLRYIMLHICNREANVSCKALLTFWTTLSCFVQCKKQND